MSSNWNQVVGNAQQKTDHHLAKALRQQAMKFLGNKCVRCGFEDIRALQIDHTKGNGAQERKELGKHAIVEICKRILRGEPGYQLLCANCNMIKVHENHEWRKSERVKLFHKIDRKFSRRKTDYDFNGFPKT